MRRWIVVVLILAILGGGVALVGPKINEVNPPPKSTPVVEEEEVLTSKGAVMPARQARLAFKVAGLILEILPKEGDKVSAGQALAHLDKRDFELQVRAAEDALALSQALLVQVQAPSRSQDVAAAAAALEAAQSFHQQLQQGAKEEDLEAARSGVRDAQVALENAKLNREVTRNNTTVAKTVRDAEDEASYYEDTYGRTLARFQDGGISKERMEQDYTNLLTSKEKLAAARQNAEITLATADNTVSKAQDALNQARVRVLRLEAGPEDAQTKASQAKIQEAQAQLDRVRQGPSIQDVEVARVRIRQAETAVEQARAATASSVLTAPFAGRIASITGRVGESVAPTVPVLVLADLDLLQIETKDLDETTAARLSIGQRASITVNAFKGKALSGRITQISPMATFTPTGDPVYTVTVALDRQDPELRWGMSAKVEFLGS